CPCAATEYRENHRRGQNGACRWRSFRRRYRGDLVLRRPEARSCATALGWARSFHSQQRPLRGGALQRSRHARLVRGGSALDLHGAALEAQRPSEPAQGAGCRIEYRTARSWPAGRRRLCDCGASLRRRLAHVRRTRRRRVAGRFELGGRHGGRPSWPRQPDRHRRSQSAAAGCTHRGDQSSGAARRQVARFRLGGGGGRWPRRRRFVRVPQCAGYRPAALPHRAHHQGQGRLLHGGSRRVASQSPERAAGAGRARGARAMNIESAPVPEILDCRVAFAEQLSALARADRRIVAVCNDSVGSSNLVAFAKEFPDRLVNVGIAEQNMVGVAAGLANGGYVPFVCAASPFLTGRALEQIKADIAYNHYHAVLCGMSPGMAYGELGPTHHSIEDLAWLRAIADLTIVVPADPEQTRQAMVWAVGAERPIFLRVGRHKVPAVGGGFEAGKIATLRDGSDVTLVATGTLVSRALEAARLLDARGISARVLNVSTIKPLDEETLLRAA